MVESGRNLVALSCSIKLVTAIMSAKERDTPITDVRAAHRNVHNERASGMQCAT